MITRSFLSIALLLISISNAYAEPVYLECTFSEDFVFKSTLDESNLKVTSTHVQSGYTFTTDGMFGPDSVMYVDHKGELAERHWTISRTDLSISYTIPNINSTSNGKCKIIKAPKERAF